VFRNFTAFKNWPGGFNHSPSLPYPCFVARKPARFAPPMPIASPGACGEIDAVDGQWRVITLFYVLASTIAEARSIMSSTKAFRTLRHRRAPARKCNRSLPSS
jgi:hypothetical protein